MKQEKALGALVGVLIGLAGGFLAGGGTVDQSYGSAVSYGMIGATIGGFLGYKVVYLLFSSKLPKAHLPK